MRLQLVTVLATYCLPDYDLPWKDSTVEYPTNLAAPLQVAIEASNGASDYGNKFGEPVLCGFARSFGLTLPGTLERREWVKVNWNLHFFVQPEPGTSVRIFPNLSFFPL